MKPKNKINQRNAFLKDAGLVKLPGKVLNNLNQTVDSVFWSLVYHAADFKSEEMSIKSKYLNLAKENLNKIKKFSQIISYYLPYDSADEFRKVNPYDIMSAADSIKKIIVRQFKGKFELPYCPSATDPIIAMLQGESSIEKTKLIESLLKRNLPVVSLFYEGRNLKLEMNYIDYKIPDPKIVFKKILNKAPEDKSKYASFYGRFENESGDLYNQAVFFKNFLKVLSFIKDDLNKFVNYVSNPVGDRTLKFIKAFTENKRDKSVVISDSGSGEEFKFKNEVSVEELPYIDKNVNAKYLLEVVDEALLLTSSSFNIRNIIFNFKIIIQNQRNTLASFEHGERRFMPRGFYAGDITLYMSFDKIVEALSQTNPLQAIEDILSNLRSSISHELTHLVQYTVEVYKGLVEPGGMPGESLRETKTNLISPEFSKLVTEENLPEILSLVPTRKSKLLGGNIINQVTPEGLILNEKDYPIMLKDPYAPPEVKEEKRIQEYDTEDYGSMWGLEREEYKKDKKDNKKPLEVPHTNVDVEFYTRIKDAIDIFNLYKKYIPLDLHRKFAKLFVGEVSATEFLSSITMEAKDKNYNDRSIEMVSSTISDDHVRDSIAFFSNLFIGQPLKYQKASKEFLKGINYDSL